MIPSTRIKTQHRVSHTMPTLTVLVQTYTPCQCVVWSQFMFHYLLKFGVVLFAKVWFFLPVQFCKAIDFTLILLYRNFQLQYLINYSFDFNNFCRFEFWLQAVCTTLLYIVMKSWELWDPNFNSLFVNYKQCSMKK